MTELARLIDNALVRLTGLAYLRVLLFILLFIHTIIARIEGEWELKQHHRDLFVWPFVLSECQGSCGRGRLGFNRRCRSGLDCARDSQDTLAAYGLDRQFAYCRISNSRRRRYFCYDPTKLISPSVRPSAKPSVSTKPSSEPSRKPSAKPSSKPSSQPTTTPKKCFTLNSELMSAVASYNASNTTQTYGKISDWCVGKVMDFSYLFYTPSYNYFNQDISKWNTSSAINMKRMFWNAISFNQDISKWDVSNVTDMYTMFYNATSFNKDISKWDVSKVTFMNYMFYGATSFNQDISKWDVSNVMNMQGMFFDATSFNQDISKWDVSKVTSMFGMFTSDISFNQNISKWDVSKVTNMAYMFSKATSFHQDISKWNVSIVTDMTNMFNNATFFNQNLSSWDVSKVTRIVNMFTGATSFNQNLCSWNAKCQSLVNSTAAFAGASSCPSQNNPICGSGPFCYNC